MNEIIDFLATNYIWFLVGAIIILLAVIGRYADKSNFGRGNIESTPKISNDEDSFESIDNKAIDENVEEQSINTIEETNNQIANETINNQVSETTEEIINPELEEQQRVEEEKNMTESFEELDKVFNETIPEKSIENEGLLEEIDKISLDKSKEEDIPAIPAIDIDDVDLPEIKDLRDDREDIWRF